MTLKICVFDMETKDSTLKLYGSGAILSYHYPEVPFQVLGCGIMDTEGYIEYFNLKYDFEETKKRLLNKLKEYDMVIGHNILYDMACNKFLFRDKLNQEKWLKVDTMLLAKMADQQLENKIKFSKKPYSLDALCKWYKVDEHKEASMLAEWAWISETYQDWYQEHSKTEKRPNGTRKRKRPPNKDLLKWCYEHLDLFPDQLVKNYCLQDLRATMALYNKLMPKLDEKHNLQEISDVLDVCLAMKYRGMKIDKEEAKLLSIKWLELSEQAGIRFKEMCGLDEKVNLSSNIQFAPRLEEMGIVIPRTEKGNYSIKGEWLEEQGLPVLKELHVHKKAKKAEKDFVQKLLKYQEIIPEKYRDDKVGVLYPTMKPLGATLTGRFSSGGGRGSYEVNILAISGRDELFGKPVRKLFLPDKNEKIVCADFSNQEPRLMAHYAKLLDCPGIDEVVAEWNENPTMKYHKKVQEMTSLDYDVAKTVTLGLAYDMHAYGLSVKLGITYDEAKALMEKYYALIPFIKPLQTIAANNIKKRGYIRTIGGRKLYIDLPYNWNSKQRTQERKGMSKLIQGSAADMTIRSMIRAHKAGLKLICVIHDELVITTDNPERDKPILVECMEGAYKLVVPVIAESGVGPSWLEAKP